MEEVLGCTEALVADMADLGGTSQSARDKAPGIEAAEGIVVHTAGGIVGVADRMSLGLAVDRSEIVVCPVVDFHSFRLFHLPVLYPVRALSLALDHYLYRGLLAETPSLGAAASRRPPNRHRRPVASLR